VAAKRARLEEHYDVRREAAPVAIWSSVALALLAFVSRRESWQLLDVSWGIWALLAIPGLLLCIDLWLGARGPALVRSRTNALVLLGVIVAGNVVGLVLLIAALITTPSDEIGGGQLLCTAVLIWLANLVVFGVWFWEVDCGGPFARSRTERAKPDFQFPQDDNPELAADGWRPRVWDYLYVSLTGASAFSPTDTMPLTLKAKLLVGLESTVSLVIVVLVTARAVNVLGS
jgi:uncharacterized membrane protein